MSRNFPIALALGALLVAPVCAQESSSNQQSLGDIARQYRNQKNASQPAKVLTNDDLGGSSSANVLGLPAADPGKMAASGASAPSPEASLDRWEGVVKQIDAIDRTKMVSLALQGYTADFPGRAEWESRLIAAKDTYVRQGHELIEEGRELLAKAHAMDREHVDASDPRAKDLQSKLKDFIAHATKMDADFQAVILEGRDLAKRAAAGSNPPQ